MSSLPRKRNSLKYKPFVWTLTPSVPKGSRREWSKIKGNYKLTCGIKTMLGWKTVVAVVMATVPVHQASSLGYSKPSTIGSFLGVNRCTLHCITKQKKVNRLNADLGWYNVLISEALSGRNTLLMKPVYPSESFFMVIVIVIVMDPNAFTPSARSYVRNLWKSPRSKMPSHTTSPSFLASSRMLEGYNSSFALQVERIHLDGQIVVG